MNFFLALCKILSEMMFNQTQLNLKTQEKLQTAEHILVYRVLKLQLTTQQINDNFASYFFKA